MSTNQRWHHLNMMYVGGEGEYCRGSSTSHKGWGRNHTYQDEDLCASYMVHGWGEWWIGPIVEKGVGA